MGKSVAKIGDVIATPGSTLPPPAQGGSGSWIAMPVIPTPFPKLTVGGTPTLEKVDCLFNFIGTTAPPVSAPVIFSEKVSLTAKKTALTVGGKNILVDGDKIKSTYGNQLEVKAPNKLTTS